MDAETGKKVKLVMLDYFERVNSDKSEDTAASKDIAGQLQDLVNDFNVAMVTLVQPNKFSLSSGPDKPIKSYTAIKGSSFLYQSFRSIISIWRPFFTPDTAHDDKYLQMAILKNDLGEIGTFNFAWNGKRGEIRECTEEEEAEMHQKIDQKNAREAGNKNDSGGWQ
jgi:replicative DNA helicase